MVAKIQPEMQNATKSCRTCMFFHSFDWPMIQTAMEAAKVSVTIIDEFRQMYSHNGEARCTLKDEKRPHTDWCKGWTEVTGTRPAWPQTAEELKKAFPNLSVKT